MAYYSKEDQLLQKLQKCVGKLQTSECTQSYRQSTREIQRPSHFNFNAPLPNNNVEPKYNSQYSTEFDNARASYSKIKQQCSSVRTFGNGDNNKYANHTEYYQKNYKPTLQPKPSTHYLADDKQQQFKQNYFPKQRRLYPKENNPNYMEQITLKQKQNFRKNYEPPRKPLQNYNLNIAINQINKEDRKIDISQPLKVAQPKNIERYQRSASKYDQYYRGDKNNQINGSNRRNILLEQDQNRVKFQDKPKLNEYQSFQMQKKMQISPKMSKYQKQQRSQRVSSFNYMNSRGRQQGSQQDLHTSRNKEADTKNRSRNVSVGSIASVSKRNISQHLQVKTKNSYETFEPKIQAELNLKQILSDVTSTNQDTFTKLQKISELNERINMRIKNIISTFQHK